MTTKAKPARFEFEGDTCGKCGGTGRYSYHGVCFSCSGAGRFLTRRGKASRAKWQAWRDEHLLVRDPMALCAGDRVTVGQLFVGPNMGGQFVKPKGARTVVAVALVSPSAVDVTIRWTGSDMGGWLRVDKAAQTLTFQVARVGTGRVSDDLYFPLTREHMDAALPTLGPGAKIVE